MKWMIDGAQQAVDLGFKFPFPKCVSDAIAAYRAENDWLGHFIEECCEVGSDLTAKSGELYSAYRAYSTANGEYIRSTTDFYSALEADGYIRVRARPGNLIKGLALVSSNDPQDEFPDFLT
jgi:phage/plasmid-associated DNA primase